MRRYVFAVAAAALLGLAAVAIGSGGDRRKDIERRTPATESGHAHHFEIKRVATGFNRPTWVGSAPGDPDALWVLDQPGRLIRVRGERRQTRLDISGRVLVGAEQGL